MLLGKFPLLFLHIGGELPKIQGKTIVGTPPEHLACYLLWSLLLSVVPSQLVVGRLVAFLAEQDTALAEHIAHLVAAYGYVILVCLLNVSNYNNISTPHFSNLKRHTVQYGRPYSNPKIHFYFCFCKQKKTDHQPNVRDFGRRVDVYSKPEKYGLMAKQKQAEECVLYVRVSTTRQAGDGVSIDAQIAKGKANAEFRNLLLPDENIFIDDGISAKVPLLSLIHI